MAPVASATPATFATTFDLVVTTYQVLHAHHLWAAITFSTAAWQGRFHADAGTASGMTFSSDTALHHMRAQLEMSCQREIHTYIVEHRQRQPLPAVSSMA